MKWDSLTLAILAFSGCVTLTLSQINEVLARIPPIIRAWRQVRSELGSSGKFEEDPDLVDGGPRSTGNYVER